MYTVLFRSAGALQGWGSSSGTSVRMTDYEPSKSGWLGLVCAMLGTDWSDDATLASLRKCQYGVRVDRQGLVIKDFRIAKLVPWSNPKKPGHKDSEPSHVFYFSDASFLVGLETENRDLAYAMYRAAISPYRIPYLGRRPCQPSVPITQPGPPVQAKLLEALLASPWLARPFEHEAINKGVRVRLSLDYSVTMARTMDLSGKPYYRMSRMDNPVSFHPVRKYDSRVVLVTEETLSKDVVKLSPWYDRKEDENETVEDDSEHTGYSGPKGPE